MGSLSPSNSTVNAVQPPALPYMEDVVGSTNLVSPRGLTAGSSNRLFLKLEGDNPAGSVKDRPARSMIMRAEERGEIEPGQVLIEATSGNTGIALAMIAAVRGYRMHLIMPENLSVERRQVMRAYGAEVVLVTKEQGMEYARDLADEMESNGEGRVLNQFSNLDNPRSHYETTGPEIWRATGGALTHFVSTMGTTGTIMGCSRFFREQGCGVQIVGVQPDGDDNIPGIRRWPPEYVPKFFRPEMVDRTIDVSRRESEEMARRLAAEEGIFAGISSGGAVAAALHLCAEIENAVVVVIICDRGDRYLSDNLYPD